MNRRLFLGSAFAAAAAPCATSAAAALMNDGCVRAVALRTDGPQDNHHFVVLPRNGSRIDLWNGTDWAPTYLSAPINVDVLDCMVEGVAHRALPADTDHRIYLFRDENGLPRVDQSTVEETADSATAYQHKIGDKSRRLVGGSHYISANGLGFGASERNNNVGSYFNRL